MSDLFNYIKTIVYEWLHNTQLNPADGTAVGISTLTFFKILPSISATLSVIWVALRIWVTIRDDFLNRKTKDGNQ